MTWILQNHEWTATVFAAVVVAVLGGLITLRATGSIRQALLTAMLRFERARRHGQLGDVDGPDIMAMVIGWALGALVPRLPPWVRPFMTAARLERLVQALYDAALDLLDDGYLNGTRPVLPGDQPDKPAV